MCHFRTNGGKIRTKIPTFLKKLLFQDWIRAADFIQRRRRRLHSISLSTADQLSELTLSALTLTAKIALARARLHAAAAAAVNAAAVVGL